MRTASTSMSRAVRLVTVAPPAPPTRLVRKSEF